MLLKNLLARMRSWRLSGLVFLIFPGLVGADEEGQGVMLGDLTWPEARVRLAESPIVILPFGAGAKEHGPHLPMNADAVFMRYLIEQAVRDHDVVVAPPILHGWFPAFRGFPGTEVSDSAVFERYVREVAQSLVAGGARRILFLNTGIDKATGLPIAIAAREIRAQTGVPTLVVSWGDLETADSADIGEQREGGHSDEIETSINLVLQPELVKMDRAVTDYGQQRRKDYGGYRPGVFSPDPNDPGYSSSGIYGDATLATADKGRRALAIMTTEWHEILNGFATSPVRQ